MADLKDFAEQLVNLTVKEVNELATILKDEYGIEPAAAAVAMAGPAAGGGDAAEEQTEFTVVLKAAGASKLAVVKFEIELTNPVTLPIKLPSYVVATTLAKRNELLAVLIVTPPAATL